MNKTWKRLVLVAAVAAVVVGGFVVVNLPTTEAVTNLPPIGTIVVCNGDKSHLFRDRAGLGIAVNTTGFLAAEVGQSFTTADGRSGVQLGVNDLFSQGTVAGLGNVTLALDKRSAGPSSLVANQKESQFPATQTMRFNFTATIDGRSYQSTTPAVVVNSSVAAFPPPAGTTYVLTNQVALEDVAAPGRVAFSLEPGKAFTVRSAG